MCNDDRELDDFDFPGAEAGGYNLLYPGDPVRQAEAMFSGENEVPPDADHRMTAQNRAHPDSPFLPRILLFLLCLAFPPIGPVLWLLRSRRPR